MTISCTGKKVMTVDSQSSTYNKPENIWKKKKNLCYSSSKRSILKLLIEIWFNTLQCQQYISGTCTDVKGFTSLIIKTKIFGAVFRNTMSFGPCIWAHFPKQSLLDPPCCNYKRKTVISVPQICMSWALLKYTGLYVFGELALSLSRTLCSLSQKHKVLQIFLVLWVFLFLADTWTNKHYPYEQKNP